MNVVLPEKHKIKKSTIILYIILALICALAILVVVESEMFGNDVVNALFGVEKIFNKSVTEETELKNNFENIFDNTYEGKDYENLVTTSYTKVENVNNSELSVNLPYVNIDNSEVKKFNEEIKDTYQAKAEQVIKENSNNTIYTVKYKATVNKDVLSVVIRSDLKHGNNPQRQMIETFNYDLKQNKTLSLKDVISKYNYQVSDVQNKINDDIKEEQNKAEEFKNLGYNIYSRDLKSDIYNVDNVANFFIYKDTIYIIFAYGNNNLTSEMDIVIL